jgi:hypothetical protein
MLNNEYRKNAISRLEKSIERFNRTNRGLIHESEILFNKRIELKNLISEVEKYINTIANTPKELNAEVKEIKITLQNYQEILDVVEEEVKKAEIKSKAGVAAGVAAGVGVAAFAPTAAMGIAMTFGVASTGTAVSALSGAAATNAALAWLGGGALTVGGAGMSGGSALLALAGPIGWAIGGASILGAGLLMNGKNKEIAAEANKKDTEVKAQTKIQMGLTKEIKNLWVAVDEDNANIQGRLANATESFPADYLSMSSDQKKILGTLVNITLAAVQTLNKTVGTL